MNEIVKLDYLCDVMSRHFQSEVIFITGERIFKFNDIHGRGGIKKITEWGLYGYKINVYLPGFIIKLIGEFYEILDEEGV